MSVPIVRRFCPAKVNLALSVGSVESDGFHPIVSWMVPISLGDDLTVQRLADADGSRFDIAWADDAPRSSPIDWPLEKDLAFRAHALFEEQLDRQAPVSVQLRKRTPTGAGLGGGSSDAAGMLLALNALFSASFDRQQLIDMSAQLGSDIAFFIDGCGAIARGRGEQIEPAPLATPLQMLLILPDFGCPTGAVYRAFDELRPSAVVQERRVVTLAAMPSLDSDDLFNDLAEPACVVQPKLRELRERCANTLQSPVHVTGSGAAMFVLADDVHDGQAKREALREIESIRCVMVHTVG
jgi:4-diphosphocytidyl-2-C-methyl-D-erythritol kinase